MRAQRLSGQITVFAALSFMLIIALITTCIRSAVSANGLTQIDMASRLAVESAFAGYNTTLMDEFDIMAVEQSGLAGKLLRYYAKNNLEGVCGDGIEYVHADFESRASMVSMGGIGVEKQIVSYMNVGIFTDILAGFLDVEKETKKAQAVAQIAEDVAKCEEIVGQSDAIIYELIELVEGIKTTESGIVVHNGKATVTGEYFAKAIITAPLTKDIAAVESDAVYGAVSGSATKYVNVYELMDNMLDYVDVYEGLEKDKEGKAEGTLAKQCENGYVEAYNRMIGAIDKVIIKIDAALETIERYDRKLIECTRAFDTCKDKVNSSGDILGEEVKETLDTDIDEMRKTNQYMGAQVCNVYSMQVALEHNKQILKRAKESVKKLNIPIEDCRYEFFEEYVAECKESFKGLSNNFLKFDYSGVNFGKGTGLKVIDTLKNTLSNGISGLVMADKEVSQCSIIYSDLASFHKGGSIDDNTGLIEKTKNLALINEYIMTRFPSATDALEGEEHEQWCELQYVVEYILCGNKSDKDNLNGVILQLCAIREGVNLSHLIIDREKRQEAMTLATSLVGATGNAAVIKAAQYLILAVWALGESICDLQLLLDGEALPMVKSKEDWNLSLANLLAMNFTVDKAGENDESDKKGLTDMVYEDYLRVLLMAKNANDKLYGVMDAMELRMIALGDDAFRMRDYMWSAKGVITLKFKDTNEYYIREISYSYV